VQPGLGRIDRLLTGERPRIIGCIDRVLVPEDGAAMVTPWELPGDQAIREVEGAEGDGVVIVWSCQSLLQEKGRGLSEELVGRSAGSLSRSLKSRCLRE
jgi:hypothetical protein